MNATDLIFYLLRCELSAVDPKKDEVGDITSDTLRSLFALAKSHDLAHMLAKPLEKLAALGDDETCRKFADEQMLAVYRYQRLNYEYGRICSTFEQNAIAYMPLKGSVIRKHYTTPWQRTSCDIDILVKEEDLDRAVDMLKSRLGYKSNDKRKHHDISLFSPGGVHLELHFSIIENIDSMDVVLDKVWEHSYRESESGYRYLQTNEFLVFHILAHAAYHFMSGGCGIRPFMDMWLLMRDLEVDMQKLSELLDAAQLKKFGESALHLSSVLFGEAEHTELTLDMINYILGAGVYGTLENKVAMSRREGGKLSYIMRRFFPTAKTMKILYPRLKKYPVLYPFYTVKRWFKILFKHNKRRVLNEIKYNANLSLDKQERMNNLRKSLELK